MSKYWQTLAPREKVLIVIAASLLLFLVGWQLVFKTLVAYPKTQASAYAKAQADLSLMQSGQAALMGRVSAVPITALDGTEFQNTVMSAAGDHGLDISRRQPKGDNELSVWLDAAPGKDFYAWTNELTKAYNIAIERVYLNRNEDGSLRVNITFVLKG